jgi:hypothetical protein
MRRGGRGFKKDGAECGVNGGTIADCRFEIAD